MAAGSIDGWLVATDCPDNQVLVNQLIERWVRITTMTLIAVIPVCQVTAKDKPLLATDWKTSRIWAAIVSTISILVVDHMITVTVVPLAETEETSVVRTEVAR